MARLSLVALLLLATLAAVITLSSSTRVTSRCGELQVDNGQVEIRNSGRAAKFSCNPGYILFDGDKVATCLRHVWNGRVPKCIRHGCPIVPVPQYGRVQYLHGQAVALYTCEPGYSRHGHHVLTCDSRAWNASAPTCQVSEPHPALSCTFEDNTCGWTNEQDNHFDWQRRQPDNLHLHGGGGDAPPADHTLASPQGHFMLASAAAAAAGGGSEGGPRSLLFSPVFPAAPVNLSCFSFHYHVYGRGAGELRLYYKPEGTSLQFVSPVFQVSSSDHNTWVAKHMLFPGATQPFQMVFESEQEGRLYSDVAIDDVIIEYDDDCTTTTIPTTTTTTIPTTTTTTTIPTTIPTTTTTTIPTTTTATTTTTPTTTTTTIPTTTTATIPTTTTTTTIPTTTTTIYTTMTAPATTSMTTTTTSTTTTTTPSTTQPTTSNTTTTPTTTTPTITTPNPTPHPTTTTTTITTPTTPPYALTPLTSLPNAPNTPFATLTTLLLLVGVFGAVGVHVVVGVALWRRWKRREVLEEEVQLVDSLEAEVGESDAFSECDT